jgi:hypothetical protein
MTGRRFDESGKPDKDSSIPGIDSQPESLRSETDQIVSQRVYDLYPPVIDVSS